MKHEHTTYSFLQSVAGYIPLSRVSILSPVRICLVILLFLADS